MRIMFVGDTLHGITGLGYAMLNIINGLNNKYNDLEIIYCTFTGTPSIKEDYNYHGDIYKDLFDKIEFVSCNINDQNKKSIFDSLIKKHKPELVFSFTDPWYLEPIAYCDYRNSFKWISYTTFEVHEYPELIPFPSILHYNRLNIKTILQKCDVCIPVTKFGKKILNDWECKTSDNIYLGLDHHLKVEKNTYTKSQIFGKSVADDDFIFMVLGKNTERKRIDFSIKAFQLFLNKYVSEDKRNKYKLYVHSDINQTYDSGTDLLTMIIKSGIANNILSSKDLTEGRELTKDSLFERYSVIDCYIGLPFGEGFGYGCADAILHGKPIIHSMNNAIYEIFESCGLFVNTVCKISARNSFIEFNVPDITEASHLMSDMVNYIETNSEVFQWFTKNCEEISNELTWENCANSFDIEIIKVMKDYKAPSFYMRRI